MEIMTPASSEVVRHFAGLHFIKFRNVIFENYFVSCCTALLFE